MHQNTLKFNDSCITVCFKVNLKIFFEFVTLSPFTEMYGAAKKWQETNSNKNLRLT